ADAFFQYQGNPSLSDTIAEVHQITCLTGNPGYKALLPAEILEVIVFRPLLNHPIIRNITDMLQQQKLDHQSDGLCRAAVILAIKGQKCTFETRPINPVR